MSPAASLLTVIGRDKPGIIAKVTEVLFRYGCNLEDVSMTVLEGELAMILVVRFGRKGSRAAVQREFRKHEKKGGLVFFWKDAGGELLRGERHAKASETYVITAAGRDRTGIVYRVSRLLADHGLNITDLNSRILGRGAKTVYSMLLEVDIPKRFPVRKLQTGLNRLSRTLGLELRLKPLERIEF